MNQYRQILQNLHLLHHEKKFHENGIVSSEDLQLLSRQDLSDLGVLKIGERNRLCAWIERQKMITSKSHPSSIKQEHSKKSDKEKSAITDSLRNIVTQTKSLIGHQSCLEEKLPITINMSMTLNGSNRRQRLLKQRSVPVMISQRKHEKNSFPELEYSSCSQTTEEDTIEKPMRRAQISSPYKHQRFLKQKSVPFLCSQEEGDVEGYSSYQTNSSCSLSSEDDTTEKPIRLAQRSNLCKRQSFFKQKSVPLMMSEKGIGEKHASQLTCSPRSQISQDDLEKKSRMIPCKRQSFYKQKSVPELIPQRECREDRAQQTLSPRKQKNEDKRDKSFSTSPRNKGFLNQSSVPQLIPQKDCCEDHKKLAHSKGSDGTQETMKGKTIRETQCFRQCKRQNLLKQKSVPLLITHKNDDDDDDDDCISQITMTHLPSNQATEEIFSEKSLRKIEPYFNDSEFSLIPDASDCKDRFCTYVFNFLMLDKKLVQLLTEKFCTMWLEGAKENMENMATKQNIGKEKIVKEAICDFRKIAHRYSHENALALCTLPDEIVARRLHKFRKMALVLACKNTVNRCLERASSRSHEEMPATRAKQNNKRLLLSAAPEKNLQHTEEEKEEITPRELNFLNDKPSTRAERNRRVLLLRAASEGTLQTAQEKDVTPQEAYKSTKGFWEGVCSYKTQSVVFPQTEPNYKSDDPHVHPELGEFHSNFKSVQLE